ncbi:MAG TPA: AAA family ATPase [Candidatus Hydrogenedens sp.]|nr:AAA family ATPase [Candidatus Hydrogenedens sp.]
MYESFYGLKEKPFNLTPDPKYLFLSDKHKEAFAHLLFGIKNKMGFVMVTGEIGTGKTTICRALLSQLDPDTEIAFIFNPCLNPIELLKRILTEFGVQTQADTLLDLTDQLNEFLLSKSHQQKNCVLVIDEAQNLTPSVLEQIRLLSNLETEKEKLLQIVLIGQPELLDRLKLHELRQLNQRITARYHLNPLDEQETKQYIAYRIHIAGGKKRVQFTPKALKLIYKHSKGIPRLINSICDRSLLVGYTQEKRVIDHYIIKKAIKELEGQIRESQVTPKKARNWKKIIPGPALIIGLAIILITLRLWFIPIDEMARELRKFNNIFIPDSKSTDTNSVLTSQVEAIEKNKDVNINPELMTKIVENLWNRFFEKAPTQTNIDSQAIDGLQVDAEKSRIESALLLLRIWNMAQVKGQLNENSPQGLVNFFNENGLSAEILQTTVSQLLTIGLPSMVYLKGKDKEFWCALIQEKENTVVCFLGPQKLIEITKDQFRSIFTNLAVIPWKDDSKIKSLTIGSSGEDVVKLKTLLQRGGWLSKDNNSDKFDEDTQGAVKKLQVEMGLPVDGVAGKQVRLGLKRWSTENYVPNLKNVPLFLLNLPIENTAMLKTTQFKNRE